MKVKVLNTCGINESLLGISLNKLQPFNKMLGVADKLAQAKEGSHKKFLRMIQVWLEVTAPMYWWTEFDTYKVGVTRNSSSIMHKPVEHMEFDPRTEPAIIESYKRLLAMYESGEISINTVKANTPAGVLYTSVINLNYQTLQTIYKDRKNHRLDEWRDFCRVLQTLPYSHWITNEKQE